MDQACGQLGDTLLAHAIEGTATPIFYRGEQVGERRVFHHRLGMWILQRRMPDRWGAWRDREMMLRDDADGGAKMLQQLLRMLVRDLVADEVGRARPKRAAIKFVRTPEEAAADQEAADQAEKERHEHRASEHEAWLDRLDRIERGEVDPTGADSYDAWALQRRQAAEAGGDPAPHGEIDDSGRDVG